MSDKEIKYSSIALSDNFFYYPKFQEVLDEVDRIHAISMRKHIPLGVSLEGPTGAGKSSILDVLEIRNPPRDTSLGIEIPFFRIETPSPVTIKGLVSDMLAMIGDPNADKGTTSSLTRRLIGLCIDCKVEYIAFDDFQHLYDSRTDNVLTEVSEWLKVLIKKLRITVIVTGVDTTIAKILNSNAQLKRLFPAHPTQLLPFVWDETDSKQNQGFVDLILGLARLEEISLQPKDKPELYRRIHYTTNGTVGYIAIMFAYARELVKEQRQRIVTLEILSNAFDNAVLAALPEELGDTQNPFNIPIEQVFIFPPHNKKLNDNEAQFKLSAR